ncbi:MAG: hypothetical protein WDN50_22430 [Bradyrhizobium sp.]
MLARKATIATVSQFSRRELASVLWLRPESIPVFPNSAEHFAATVPDFGIIDRVGAESRSFLSFGRLHEQEQEYFSGH